MLKNYEMFCSVLLEGLEILSKNYGKSQKCF